MSTENTPLETGDGKGLSEHMAEQQVRALGYMRLRSRPELIITEHSKHHTAAVYLITTFMSDVSVNCLSYFNCVMYFPPCNIITTSSASSDRRCNYSYSPLLPATPCYSPLLPARLRSRPVCSLKRTLCMVVQSLKMANIITSYAILAWCALS